MKKIRYAVVGLGYISQAAVLPAFSNARENCELAALVSGDSEKLEVLGNKYGVSKLYAYDRYDELLSSGDVDAVYIALPNSMHADFAIRAARAGVHILCEKPLAVSVEECERMIDAADEHGVKLMTAYRLHFEEANLKAVEIARSGELGEPRFFESIFSFQVREDDIRVQRDLGGWTLYDIGVYCINAARAVFRSEPVEAFAFCAGGSDERFTEIEHTTAALLRFPGNKLASFTASFGSSDISAYRIVGSKGDLRVSPAFDIGTDFTHELTIGGRTEKSVFKKRDHFAPELVYFSQCLIENCRPEPSGEEGLADVRIVQALYESARTGQAVKLEPASKNEYPSMYLEMKKPPIREPKLFHAHHPAKG